MSTSEGMFRSPMQRNPRPGVGSIGPIFRDTALPLKIVLVLESVRQEERSGEAMTSYPRASARRALSIGIGIAALAVCTPVLAQTSPFLTGATALESNILAWLTPIAIILVMVLGAMAMANRISWGWAIGAILGIAIAFGAPQIVTWVRGMFGV